MRYALRFMWNATRGHRLTPWRSPYLLWRIETYTGVKMTQIGFLEFWEFLWPVIEDGACVGIVAQDMRTMQIKSFRADAVVMATGGNGL